MLHFVNVFDFNGYGCFPDMRISDAISESKLNKDEKLKAKYVILAKNCNEANYVKLVKGLASRNKIPVIEVE